MEANVDNLLTGGEMEPPVENDVVEAPVEEVKEDVPQDVPQEQVEQKAEAEAESEPQEYDDYGDEPEEFEEEPTITKSQMQKMMQERLRREQLKYERMLQEAQASQQQEVQQPDPYQPNDANPEDWEAQLDNILEKRMSKIEEKRQQEAIREREMRAQREFEHKFEAGMTRYKDFQDIVDPYSMTDAMMMATRSLRNPAAFIYSANKSHGDDLARIRELSPPEQMVEIGRLEERMRRQRPSQSQAPKPISNDVGDVKHKPQGLNSVDDLLMQEQRRRMKK